jgi:hypothetical protein
VSFAAITLCVASRVFIVIIVVYFVIDSVRKLLDAPAYLRNWNLLTYLFTYLLTHSLTHSLHGAGYYLKS